MTLGNKIYSLQIWDTAGQEKFRALTSSYYKGAHACVCVFDLSVPETLTKCEYYIDKALEEEIEKECIVLVGNKGDIEGCEENQKAGEEFAEKFGIKYKTVSAKEGTNVIEVFNAVSYTHLTLPTKA